MRHRRFRQGHKGYRRALYSLAVLGGLGLLALPRPASAEPPTLIHDRIEAQFSDPDFCGSGMTVDVVVSAVQTVRLADDEVQGSGSFRVVLTNPETGASVVVSAAGQVRDEVVSGDPDGIHTHLLTLKGLPEKIQSAGGEVLLRDAGVIAFVGTFDGDRLIRSDLVLQRGPHPEADADFTLFCSTVVSALA